MLTLSEGEIDISKILNALPRAEVQHMHRVGALVDLFSKKLCENTDSEENKYYGEAASFHDIGKAWIPAEILTKPGQLTDEEKIFVFQHPLFAKRLFDQKPNGSTLGLSERILPLAAQSAVYHHEWWNGTGYPYRIKYDAIPFVARITSICDAYDAMTSDRAYRRARTHAYACQQIEENAGTQFDPDLAYTFLNNEAKFAAFARSSADNVVLLAGR